MVMGGCHDQTAHGKNDFLISAYSEAPDGRMKPEIPDALPCLRSDSCCLVREHSWRDRKSGPSHPLLVVVCREHRRHFTIYPPGFAPYLRAPLDPQARQSVFTPASSVAGGERRPRESLGGPCWRTQRRWLSRLAVLLGLVGQAEGEAQRELLGVSLSAHTRARQLAQPGEWRRLAQAIVEVVTALGRVDDPLRGLLRAGQRVGRWGRAFAIDERRRIHLVGS